MTLSDEQRERYLRQIILPEIGGPGQERLRNMSVDVFGRDDGAQRLAGELIRAGVGRATLSDRGVVRELQRQYPKTRIIFVPPTDGDATHSGALADGRLLIVIAKPAKKSMLRKFPAHLLAASTTGVLRWGIVSSTRDIVHIIEEILSPEVASQGSAPDVDPLLLLASLAAADLLRAILTNDRGIVFRSLDPESGEIQTKEPGESWVL